MALFYLQLCNGSGFTEDQDGQDLPDVEAAQRVAIESLRDILAEEVRHGRFNKASFIEIEDEDRRQIATIRVSDAVEITDWINGSSRRHR